MISNKPKIVGVLNVTPDSFSDGGKFNTVEKALKHALEMEIAGADIIDIGGESTGPGSKDISEEEELLRVIPILKALRPKTKLQISIDTYKSQVAKQALQEGANIINDVTGLRGDAKMAETIAKFNCPIVIMFAKENTPRTSTLNITYDDILETIGDFFIRQMEYAKSQGIKPENIILDPGMGQFISGDPKYSIEIIERLNELVQKFPQNRFLLGISRKSFLGGDIKDRDELAKPLTELAIQNGASIIRTHDVKSVKDIIDKLSQISCQK